MTAQSEDSATDAAWFAIENILSDISEEFYCAGWMHNTEYEVWRLMTEGGSWGLGGAESVPEHMGALRSLSRSLGVWVTWEDFRDERGVHPIPLDEWHKRYDAWRGSVVKYYGPVPSEDPSL